MELKLEAAVGRCSMKNVFLKISQESTCVGVFFKKVLGLSAATLLKRDSKRGVFL